MDKPSAVSVAEPEVLEDDNGIGVPAEFVRNVLDVARRREELLRKMRDALLGGRDSEVIELAERLCGVNHDKK
jgi:hypothetical protein